MDFETTASIASHARLSLRYFDQLSLLLQDPDHQQHAAISYSAACDELGRFRIWAGNIGALQDDPKRTSLGFRLREAPRVANQVVELLQDLSESLEEMCSIVSGKRPNRVNLPPDLDEEYLSLERISRNEDCISGDSVPTSELQELFESTAETITSLFKLSIVIRNATFRDRYARALAAAKEPLNDSFDISHVGDKFPRLRRTPWLEKRLGKAITQRRQYLKYCQEHHDRLGGDIEHDGENRYPSRKSLSRMLNRQMQQPGEERKSDMIAKPPSTLNSTAASTLAATLLNGRDELSDEDRSLTSYATSLGEDSGGHKLRVPPLPEEAAKGKPFQCRYCWGIQQLKNVRSWRKHVFNDLKSYVCTFEACDLKMFADRRSWFDHELQVHWVEWCCQFCSRAPFKSREKLEAHMQSCHVECFTASQLPALTEISQQTLAKIPATACPFCEEWESFLKEANPQSSRSVLVVTPVQYRHHVGAHMEQLALFAIPRAHEHAGNDACSTELSIGAKADSRVNENYDSLSQISNEDIENPALHIAAYVGNEDEVVLLLENGEDVNTKGDTWGSALCAAVVGCHPKVVKILLESGADIEAHCGQYNTVLEAAAAWQDEDIEKLLKETAHGENYEQDIKIDDELSQSKFATSNRAPYAMKPHVSEDTEHYSEQEEKGKLWESKAKELISMEYERCKDPDFRRRPKYKDVRAFLDSLSDLNSKPAGTIDLEKEIKRHEDWMRKGKKLFGKANAPLRILQAHMNRVADHNQYCFELQDKPRMPVEPPSREHTPVGSQEGEDVFCICRQSEAGMMIECELCHEWYHGKCLKIARGKVKEDDRYICPVCDWRVKIPRDAARPKLEALQDWQNDIVNLPFQPEEGDTLDEIITTAQNFRDFMCPYINSVMSTPEEVTTQRFYLRKIEGAEVLLAYETNFFRQELHKWAPVAPDAPPLQPEEVNAQAAGNGTRLLAATKNGNIAVVRELLKKGVDVNAQDEENGTALQAASSSGHEEIAKLLLENGANVNAKDETGSDALQVASENGHGEIARLLVERGADVNAEGGLFGTALQAASNSGLEEIARLLVGNGADVNAESGSYGTALQAASRGGHKEIAKLLLENGANVNAEGGNGGNALQVASSNGHDGIVRFLLNNGAKLTQTNTLQEQGSFESPRETGLEGGDGSSSIDRHHHSRTHDKDLYSDDSSSSDDPRAEPQQRQVHVSSPPTDVRMDPRRRRPPSPGRGRISQPRSSSTGTLIYPPLFVPVGASASTPSFLRGYRQESSPHTKSRNDYVSRPRRLTLDPESGATRRPLTVIPPSSPNRKPVIYIAGSVGTGRMVSAERSERGGYRSSGSAPSGYHLNTPVVRSQDTDDRNYGYEYTDFKKEQYRDLAAPGPKPKRDSYKVSGREQPLSLTGLEEYLPRISQPRAAGPPIAMNTRGFTNNLGRSASLRQTQQVRDDDAGPRDRPRESYGAPYSQESSRAPMSLHQPSDDSYLPREDSKELAEARHHRHRKPSFDEERPETKLRGPHDDPYDRSRHYHESSYHRDHDRDDRDRRVREESHRSEHDRVDDKSDISQFAGAALASAAVGGAAVESSHRQHHHPDRDRNDRRDDRRDERREDSVKEYIKDSNRDYLPVGQESVESGSISKEAADEKDRERRERLERRRRQRIEKEIKDAEDRRREDRERRERLERRRRQRIEKEEKDAEDRRREDRERLERRRRQRIEKEEKDARGRRSDLEQPALLQARGVDKLARPRKEVEQMALPRWEPEQLALTQENTLREQCSYERPKETGLEGEEGSRSTHRRHHSPTHNQDSYSDDSSSPSDDPRLKLQVRRVSPPQEREAEQSIKGILRQPREKFPEDPTPIREGVAPLKDGGMKGIPPNARWTKIDRELVSPEALEEGNERFEERPDFVIVLRVLTREEIEAYALKTQEIRGRLGHESN